MTLGKAIICDIDGTVALMHGNRTPFEWMKVDTDLPNQWVIDLLCAYTYGNDITVLFLSGRSEECYDLTLDWLNEHVMHGYMEPHGFKLFMRPVDQLFEKDAKIKYEFYHGYIKPYYDVQFVIDDRKQVVDMWRNVAGLPVAQVAEGNF